eukprot:Awhi_evm1s13571
MDRRRFTDAFVKIICDTCINLKSLDISYNRQVTMASLPYLQTLPLMELQMSDIDFLNFPMTFFTESSPLRTTLILFGFGVLDFDENGTWIGRQSLAKACAPAYLKENEVIYLDVKSRQELEQEYPE